jgi:hypothetical protein
MKNFPPQSYYFFYNIDDKIQTVILYCQLSKFVSWICDQPAGRQTKQSCFHRHCEYPFCTATEKRDDACRKSEGFQYE